MDIPEWYAIALISLITFYASGFLLVKILRRISPFARSQFLTHVYYPQIHKYLRGTEKATRFDLLLTVIFLLGVVVSTTVYVDDVPGLSRRSALLSIINIIPSALGAHMNLVADNGGVGLGTHSRIHRWFGRTAIIEGLIHTTAAISLKRPNFRVLQDIGGFSAAVTVILIWLASLQTVRQHFYEIFHKSHLMLAATLFAALLVHNQANKLSASSTIFLLIAICCQLMMGILRLGQLYYRNIKYGKPLGRAVVQTITFKRDIGRDIPVSDAVHVHVRLSRPWRIRAGQYVYLSIPGVNRTSFAQSHPFYVTWWYQDHGHDYAVFLVEKREGFTKDLLLYASDANDPSSSTELRIILEGPYGRQLNLESYETVLLFATGIGIAGQMPFVRQLLEAMQKLQTKTRKIVLHWEMVSELHAAWVANMMKELLAMDINRILDIKLFVLGRFLSIHTHNGDNDQIGKSINITYSTMDPESLVKSEIGNQLGSTMVSLCTNDEMSDKIRCVVRRMMDKSVHLEELEFRPADPRRNGDMTKELVRDRGSTLSVNGL